MTYMQPRRMKRGDLAPELRVQVTSDDLTLTPEALTGANIMGRLDGTVIFNRPAATITAVPGGVEVTMAFEAADTDEAGPVDIEVELIWPGNKPQTIRTGNILLITPDIA